MQDVFKQNHSELKYVEKKESANMGKKTITNLLEKIEMEVTKSYDGVDEYATTLKDTCVITEHLDKIDALVRQIKEMI